MSPAGVQFFDTLARAKGLLSPTALQQRGRGLILALALCSFLPEACAPSSNAAAGSDAQVRHQHQLWESLRQERFGSPFMDFHVLSVAVLRNPLDTLIQKVGKSRRGSSLLLRPDIAASLLQDPGVRA
eukprot:2636977-Alexandrium_andersonii.AAC.1